MPNFADRRDRVAPPFTHPGEEALSSYLATTTPDRPRQRVEDRTPFSPGDAGYDTLVQLRTEELWDTLADFA